MQRHNHRHARCGPEHDGWGDAASTPAQRAWVAFHRAMIGHRHLMLQKLTEQGVPPGQAMSLRALAHDDGISQSDLAARLHVARPTVTVMLQKMERSNLIERRPDAEDQRLTRVYVTAEGRALQERMRTSFAEIVEAAMGALSEKDQIELERLLTILGDNLTTATEGDNTWPPIDDEDLA